MDIMLTTVDNPYDPFTQFIEWFTYDMEKGYNTCDLLGRVTHNSIELTEKDYDAEHLRAMEEVVHYNVSGLHKLVYR